MLPLYQYRAALGGGFGGVENTDWQGASATTEAGAEGEAYQAAIDVYETYEGLYGLRDIATIVEEDGVDEDEAREIYENEREGWLEWEVRPYQEDDE